MIKKEREGIVVEGRKRLGIWKKKLIEWMIEKERGGIVVEGRKRWREKKKS